MTYLVFVVFYCVSQSALPAPGASLLCRIPATPFFSAFLSPVCNLFLLVSLIYTQAAIVDDMQGG